MVILLAMLVAACNMTNHYSGAEQAGGGSDAIRRVFGLRYGMELNATMFAATQPSAQIDGAQPNSITPNSDTNCRKQGKKGQWKTTNKNSPYCQVSNLLPADAQVQSFTGTTQTGVFKLASHYCSQLMANSEKGKQARLAKLPTSAKELNKLDFRQRPVELGGNLKKQLAKELGNLISPSSDAEQQILTELIDDLATTKEQNGQLPSLEEVLIGVCTAALGSAQTTFY